MAVDTQDAAKIIREKNQSGREYVKAFKAGGEDLPGRRREMTEQQRENIDKVIALKTRLALMGVRSAFVLNMNPYPLKVNGVLMDDIEIPACPEGKEWIIEAIHEERIAWRDDKDDALTPIEFVPIILAREFERIYYKAGGVVIFEATGDVEQPDDPEDTIIKNKKLQEKIKEAQERMLKFASDKYQEAETYYNAPGRVGFRDITTLHRAMTSLLFRKKMLPEKPKWFEPTKSEMEIAEPCPRCKAEPKKGATMCPSCGFIIDPAQAFLLGDLDPLNDSDKRALQRLARAKLKELNISHLVEQNLDERSAQLAKDAKGPKDSK